MEWIEIEQMKVKKIYNIRNKFFKDSNKDDKSFLIYASLVGLFEGNGYFSIGKKGKILTYELGIELSIRDVQLIYKIKSLLGVGVVRFRKRGDIKMVSLIIRNKNHLKLFILPIFDKYPMFSNKQYDYLRFRDCLTSNINKYADLPPYTRGTEPLNDIQSILNAPYFSSWLIGFIEAEGSFYLVSKTSTRIVHAFEITQKLDVIVLKAISLILGVNVVKKNTYNAVITTNSRAIENIMSYFCNCFKGMKGVEFRIWARSYVKHKGKYEKLSKIRKLVRNLRSTRLDKDFKNIHQD